MSARCSAAATDVPIDGDLLRALRDQVCRTAEAFDAQVLERDDAVVALEEWSAIVHAADAALALATARIADLGPPPSAGAHSAAGFVAKTTGTTSAKATEKIKTGNGLRANGKTRAEAVAGKLSEEQTAAITDALTVNPNAEEKLLGVAAQGSLGALRDECAKSKAEAQDLAEVEKRIHSRRSLRRYRDSEGAEHLHAVGTRATMARIDQALKPIVDDVFKRARTDGVREPLDAYQYDALVELADRSLCDGAGRSTRPRKPTIRNLVVLRIDLEALTRGRPETGETCEIAGLGPISVETAREMLGESIVKLVITKGVDVLNVTHLGRGPNIAQKIALLWQQPVCIREGCNNTARVEYNHAYGVEYRKTKHTRLDETDPTCHGDHDLITYEGWALVEGTGKRPMVPPDDPRHPKNRPKP
jgi:hypothetical protein